MIEPDKFEVDLSPRAPWWRNWKVMLPVWCGIGGLMWLGLYFNVDRSLTIAVITGIVVGFVLGKLL